MPQWSDYEQESGITDVQKLEAVRRLREWNDEQLVSFLDSQNRNWYNFLFPSTGGKFLNCTMPYNNHGTTVDEKYVCSKDATHEFCSTHHLSLQRCPYDDGYLTKQKA